MFDLNESAIFTKYIAAGSPYTPEIVLVRLSQEPYAQVRRRVAENAHTPAEILERLAQDANPEVRLSLRDNTACTAAMIERLTRDDCPDVRYAMAENHELPNDLLHNLMHDENPYVADRAIRTLDRKYPSATARQLAINNDDNSIDRAV